MPDGVADAGEGCAVCWADPDWKSTGRMVRVGSGEMPIRLKLATFPVAKAGD